MATSPDIRCQSVPMGYHRGLGRGSPSWGGVRGAPVSWMLVFPSGRCSLSSLPKRPQIPGWGMCLGREFHPNGTGPGPGAGLPLRFSLPIWLRHTDRIGHADGCKQWDTFAAPAQPSPVPGASQGTGRMEAQVRTQQHPCSWNWALHSRWGASLPPFPLRLLPPSLLAHPVPKPGCAWHSRGDRKPVESGEQSLSGRGKGLADTSQTPPHPLPPSPSPCQLLMAASN